MIDAKASSTLFHMSAVMKRLKINVLCAKQVMDLSSALTGTIHWFIKEKM